MTTKDRIKFHERALQILKAIETFEYRRDMAAFSLKRNHKIAAGAALEFLDSRNRHQIEIAEKCIVRMESKYWDHFYNS